MSAGVPEPVCECARPERCRCDYGEGGTHCAACGRALAPSPPITPEGRCQEGQRRRLDTGLVELREHLCRLLRAVLAAPPDLLFLPDRRPRPETTHEAVADMLAAVDRRRRRT
jgi:hypothetical protein